MRERLKLGIRQARSRSFGCFLALALCTAAAPATARDIALNADGTLLATANHDARSLSLIDPVTLEHLRDIPLGLAPDNVAFDADGRVWVSFRQHDRIMVIEPGSGTHLASIGTGDEPFDLLNIAPDRMAVSQFRDATVVFIDTMSFEITEFVETSPHPRGLAMSADGKTIYVTHFQSGALSVVDLANGQVVRTIQAEADGNLLQNVAVTADGSRLYLPHTRANATNPSILFDTTVFPVVSVVDPTAGIPVFSERFSLDIVAEPVGIPLDAALTEAYLFVLNAASNDLVVIDRASRLATAHIELGANPRSMVLSMDKAHLFIHNTLSASVSVLDTGTLQVTTTISVAPNPLPQNLLNGKRIFNDSSRTDMARDQWIACATCHFDGELDGRTWFFPDGPRNTPSLLGSADTAPYHWSGDLDELHDVESTIRILQAGTGLAPGPDNCAPACDQAPPNSGRSQDLDDLAAYMASLRLPPNPNLEAGNQLSAAAIRGMELFESGRTQCAQCHLAPNYSDGLRHDVGTGEGAQERKGPAFDTPSLRGIYATAPYLHDGRAETIASILTLHNPDDRHGATSELSDEEIGDLVEFLKSLGRNARMFNSSFEPSQQ